MMMMRSSLISSGQNSVWLLRQQHPRAFSVLAGAASTDVLNTQAPTRTHPSHVSTRRCKSSLSRYGLGGHHWKSFTPESYQTLIREALASPNHPPVSYLEVAGQEGGDVALTGAIQSALETQPELANLPLTITTRVGYKILNASKGKKDNDAAEGGLGPGDVLLQEAPSQVVNPNDGEANDENNQSRASPGNGTVVHNLSSEHIQQVLQESPLLELQKDLKHLNLIYLVQNPEVQVLELLQQNDRQEVGPENRQAFIQQRWTSALETLQDFCAPHQNRVSFGVVSNGLGIPASHNHPLHLATSTVVQAAKSYPHFLTVHLPANLLELQGWQVAKDIKAEVPDVFVGAIRPWTCYPDLGTGSGHSFRLVDYALPSLDGGHPHVPIRDEDVTVSAPDSKTRNSGNETQYTHQMSQVPAIYQIALQTAMSHFDGEELLEIKQERELTVEERETLDGCKLVQSMIHDLDADLEQVRSFSAHEDELYGRIIPLLYDTFEAMDDHTSDVLQAYFAAYAVAVRYAIAKKTRQVLKEGEKEAKGKDKSPTYPDIPDSMMLQEYALRKMLAEPVFDRIIIGSSTMQDFRHQIELFEMIGKEEGSPLEAIEKANQALEEKRQEKEKELAQEDSGKKAETEEKSKS